MRDLYTKARETLIRQCRKHELAPDAEVWATEQINAMTNDELLRLISDTLEEETI